MPGSQLVVHVWGMHLSLDAKTEALPRLNRGTNCAVQQICRTAAVIICRLGCSGALADNRAVRRAHAPQKTGRCITSNEAEVRCGGPVLILRSDVQCKIPPFRFTAFPLV